MDPKRLGWFVAALGLTVVTVVAFGVAEFGIPFAVMAIGTYYGAAVQSGRRAQRAVAFGLLLAGTLALLVFGLVPLTGAGPFDAAMGLLALGWVLGLVGTLRAAPRLSRGGLTVASLALVVAAVVMATDRVWILAVVFAVAAAGLLLAGLGGSATTPGSSHRPGL